MTATIRTRYVYPTSSNTYCDCEDPYPQGTDEICGDGADNDCSGTADDRDYDEDGYIDEECAGDDCDDTVPYVNPGQQRDRKETLRVMTDWITIAMVKPMVGILVAYPLLPVPGMRRPHSAGGARHMVLLTLANISAASSFQSVQSSSSECGAGRNSSLSQFSTEGCAIHKAYRPSLSQDAGRCILR